MSIEKILMVCSNFHRVTSVKAVTHMHAKDKYSINRIHSEIRKTKLIERVFFTQQRHCKKFLLYVHSRIYALISLVIRIQYILQ